MLRRFSPFLLVAFTATMELSCHQAFARRNGPSKIPVIAFRNSNVPRIVGGTEADPHGYPYQAYLQFTNPDGWIFMCGGVLIHPEWVLTAAHCTDGKEKVDVFLGAHNLSISESTVQAFQVKSSSFIQHEGYAITDKRVDNDIALIQLPKPVTLTDEIKTIAFAAGNPPAGTSVTATGWGLVKTNGSTSTVLYQVDVAVVPDGDCQAIYAPTGIRITNLQICIDNTGGKGICFGDSGGPLAWKEEGVVVGIASFGTEDCQDGYPHVFTRVTAYIDWIKEKLSATPRDDYDCDNDYYDCATITMTIIGP